MTAEEDSTFTHEDLNLPDDDASLPAIQIPPPIRSTTSTTSTTSSNTTTGGFFSLGDSNIAERARQLKEERDAEKTNSSRNVNHNDNNDESVEGVSALLNGDSSTTTTTKEEKDETEDLHEFDSLLICNQIHEKDNSLFHILATGFEGLKLLRDDFTDDNAMAQMRQDRRRYAATVNFIDPTTKTTPAATSPSSKMNVPDKATTNVLQQQSMFQRQESSNISNNSSIKTKSIENVYEKLTHIFERDYRSTLRSVQYRNLRTGETDYISSLPVNTVITRAGVAMDTKSNKGVNTPWGGTSSTAIVPVNDPSEWHTGPFCHVYIAACENMEHYRTKFRPALQAFVSQIESASSITAANQQGGHSADYLIVYVPVGGGASVSNMKDSALSPEGNSKRRGFLQTARKRWTATGSTTTAATATTTPFGGEEEDTKSSGSVDSNSELPDSPDVDDPDSIAMNTALKLLSPAEQKLYKKIVADFPNGKACVLSMISLDRSDADQKNSESVAIRTQEWSTFNRMLGAVIVNGFRDRCRRYKDELKRLDAQRATAATAAKNSQGSGIGNYKPPTKPNPYSFNLGHFFLVKESLAFTYEQMQLPGEALLQYDEFRLYMPDLGDKEERKVRRARRKSVALKNGDGPSLTELADSGDFLGFRKKVRTEYDLTATLDVMRRYLFARELALLFRMEDPVEILNRCQNFVKAMYAIMLRGVKEFNEDEQKKRNANAAQWVVQFSWDVKTASRPYFRGSGDTVDDRSVESFGSVDSSLRTMAESATEQVAGKITDLLEISRSMLLQLGETMLPEGSTLLSAIRQALPEDLRKEWPEWQSSDNLAADGASKRKRLTKLHDSNKERQFLLNGSFSSPASFEETYLDLCESIIQMSRKARRTRLAARLRAELGEYYVRTGDLRSAIPLFKQVLKRYRIDQWDHCHFWRLFRLAYCQRTTAKPTEYLKTLVACFSPRITAVAPTKALCTLQKDLERVLEHSSVGQSRYGRLSFIETSLNIPKSSSKKMTIGQGTDRKSIVKRFCAVGDNIDIEVSIKSYLPSKIDLNSVKLFIINFDKFAAALEEGSSIEEEDADEILSLAAPVSVHPRLNNFCFSWSPQNTGQYILSTIELIWNQGYFYYDSVELPHPVLGADVLPSEPTSSILIEPEFLVPGHDQVVSVIVDGGSDVIVSGKLLLSCSQGVFLALPDQNSTAGWQSKSEIEIQPMKPGEQQTFYVRVRCGLVENLPDEAAFQDNSIDIVQGLGAKLLMTYMNCEASNYSDGADLPSMRTVLETFTPVLKKSALSVEKVEVYVLEPYKRFVLCILLSSNTPYNYFVDDWNIEIPSPIKVTDDASLNQDLIKRSVSDGDQLSIAVEFSVDYESTHSTCVLDESELRLKLRDDSLEIFTLNLPLHLEKAVRSSGVLEAPKLLDCLDATLKISRVEGQVGEPVSLEYTINVSEGFLDENTDLCFTVISSRSPWLIGGKVSGAMKKELSKMSCEVIGIPMVAGELGLFPTINLTLVQSDGSRIPLSVDQCCPQKFLSIPKFDAIAVASPSLKAQ